MQIQIDADHNIQGTEKLAVHAKGVVENAIGRFKDRITPVEVHLSDQNGEKSGQDDKRCLLEARLKGRMRTAITRQVAILDQAVEGAAELKRSLEDALGRLADIGYRRAYRENQRHEDQERRLA